MRIQHQRIQHGVGQGSFHSASLVYEGNGKIHRFDYVYDCGAVAAFGKPTEQLSRAINRMWAVSDSDRGKPILDLLVISHFDWDHLNGAKYLIESLDVKRIVLPYIGPEELMLIVASASLHMPNEMIEALHGLASGNGTLWSCPVIMVRSEPELPPFEDDLIEKSDQPKDNPHDSLVTRCVLVSSMDEMAPKGVIGHHESLKVAVPKDKFFWKLRFWNRGMDSLLVDLLKKHLTAAEFPFDCLCDKEQGAKEIISWLGRSVEKTRNKSQGKKAKTVTHREKMVNAYREAVREYKPEWIREAESLRLSNFLSLAMYSGPELSKNLLYRSWFCNVPGSYGYIRRGRSLNFEAGWVGTGDAPLGEPGVWQDFKSHFYKELPNVDTLLIPHHGAAPTKGPRFYPSDYQYTGLRNAVISYGSKNNYGHPRAQVLAEIVAGQATPILVNESSVLGFQEDYVFYGEAS